MRCCGDIDINIVLRNALVLDLAAVVGTHFLQGEDNKVRGAAWRLALLAKKRRFL